MRAKTKPGKRINDDTDTKTVRALSDSTIRQTYTVLRAGLDGAVRDGLLGRNPAAAVTRPGIARQEVKHLDASGVALVLKHAEESRYHAALVLIASTGLRKGQALGLAWDRIDLDTGVLKVTATLGRIGDRLVMSEPKTACSRRAVPLNAGVVTMLRKHRAAQLADRLRGGNQWRETGLVFTTEFGGPVDPRNLLRVIEVAAKAAGVADVGVHTLRHSAAVAWLEAGCTSRPSPTCSAIRQSRSRATSTDTRATTPPGPPSTAWRVAWGSDPAYSISPIHGCGSGPVSAAMIDSRCSGLFQRFGRTANSSPSLIRIQNIASW
ncbi:site-specific integrase [Mycobacterium sp. 3-98]|uniref:site-specific integrase n=1 Tax=Mycobacterium sp. 3-98 TaxID=3042317 RepID=UPI002DD89BD2|nr:site-specific integrase [Mycobacterium sp. 3-98]WSE44265.1 site-specific integrase [Mycobacterium sp. 3-98]